MKKKKNLTFIAAIVVISIVLILILSLFFGKKTTYATNSITTKTIGSEVLADGTIASEDEVALHFQTGGKLVYLSSNEGDMVYQGQTIARLDSYALKRQVQIAANSYQAVKNNTEQTLENNQAGVLEGQQRISLDTTDKNSYKNTTEVQVITDAVKRIVDNVQLTADTAKLNVDLANYAVQLSMLTAPFGGMIVHEDVDVPNVNITPATSFILIDPHVLIFKAFVNAQDIDFVSMGSKATISLNGDDLKHQGYVTKIYPEKTILPNGQSGYRVDVTSVGLANAKYAQGGSVEIKSNVLGSTKLVPVWTVLSGQQIWVKEGNLSILKTVKVGKTHGDFIEVLSGLNDADKIIVAPQSIVQDKYLLL